MFLHDVPGVDQRGEHKWEHIFRNIAGTYDGNIMETFVGTFAETFYGGNKPGNIYTNDLL